MSIDEETADGLLVTKFTVCDADFGVDARLVLEVVKVGELTRVHDAPRGVAGIRNLRGRIVTVVDTAVHLDLGRVEMGNETRMLIMENQGEAYGFLVDSVTDAFSLEEEQLGAPPASLDNSLRSKLIGVWRDGDRLTAILDPQSFFQWEAVSVQPDE